MISSKHLVLQDVTEDLDPSLNPILLQETTIRGAHHIIKLGDTEIEYNNNFRSVNREKAPGYFLQNMHLVSYLCNIVILV